MPIKAFIDQLSERRVYRATAMYVVAVFALWQAADIAIPALGLPEAMMRYVVGGAILGFPVVVILSWIYDLRIESCASDDRTTRRIIGFGVLGTFLLTIGIIVVRSESGPETFQPIGLPFAMGVEEFFSGNLEQAQAIFNAVASDRSDPEGNQRDALRYLVRAYDLSGQRDKAMDAVRRLLALEPPIALMAPSVETDSVMALYYDARRERLAAAVATAPQSAVEAIEVFAFVDRTTLRETQTNPASPAEGVPEEAGLGDGLAAALTVELNQRAAGIKIVDRSSVGGERGFGVYRYLESPSADRIIRPTHLVFGSIAGQESSQVLLSAWVFEAASGRLTHSSQALGPWGDIWAILARLADDLMVKLLQDRA